MKKLTLWSMDKVRLFAGKTLHALSAAVLIMMPLQYASALVSQAPLFLGGGGGVPGNLVLTPSVEYPTIQSLANLGDYTTDRAFEGYFDSEKCYKYDFVGKEHKDNHFYPTRTTPDRRCLRDLEWSGNFLNWATTQTIDPFRKALTGGYRVKDTPTETWLEKARFPKKDREFGEPLLYPLGQMSGVDPREISGEDLVTGATPFKSHGLLGLWPATSFRVKIDGVGKRMWFLASSAGLWSNLKREFDPDSLGSKLDSHKVNVYKADVRVKVCDETVGLEDNCKKYSEGWKPEGLIQQNSDRIRYSVLSYLNDDNMYRDGGVLRAAQKYVGPKKLVAGEGFIDNEHKEWDPVTGVMIDNPDPDDADATHPDFAIENSGVINYINKFGQLNDYKHKPFDPVSELYYAATRYLKGQSNISFYSSLEGFSLSKFEKQTDGFPVITDWENRDPIQYECQPNVILGIGDVYTHKDKKLPGNTVYHEKEPNYTPPEVTADKTVNVVTATNWVGKLEGLGDIGNTNRFDAVDSEGANNYSGNHNSAFIAGLAYDNHTKDLRLNMPGKQTASTHWVDVLENGDLKLPSRNQYYLAAKYGGFDVPDGYKPYSNDHSDSLEEEWWQSGEILSIGGVTIDRPRNYYIAGEASKMIDSLRQAFRNITKELKSSASSLAANSTSLQGDTAIFQAAFDSTRWSGDIRAFKLQSGGTISDTPHWSAAAKLDALNDTAMSSRNILTGKPLPETSGNRLTTTGSDFKWASLDTAQQEALRKTEDAALEDKDTGKDRLAFIRGVRAKEQTSTNQAKPFRRRDSRLGDIANSAPQYIHQTNYGYFALHSTSAFSGINRYSAFRDKGVYKNRPPILVAGAGDGMLHGFNASVPDSEGSGGENGGKELFAYVPAGVYDNLWELTEPDYDHRYFVDGTPRVSDAWLGSSLGWRTIVAGTTGAGGKSVFVLDVTDPSNMSSSNVLWEFSHEDMGYTIQQPSIFALPNGEFGVVVSSGYGTGSDSGGSVWILNAATGDVIHKIDLPTGKGELGSPNVIDTDGDRIADRIYIADTGDTDATNTGGRVWRIDLEGESPAAWKAPASPLFTAGDEQAITADLVASFNEKNEVMVFFGTGSFQDVGDNVVPETSPRIESFYGIVDRGDKLTRSDLFEQEILDERVVNGKKLRVVSEKKVPSGTFNGWYLDLVWKASNGGPGGKGERVVARALVRSDRVIFPTLIPSADPCAEGGSSWLMEVSLYTGKRLNYEVFEINDDDVIDSKDRIPGEGGDDPGLPPSGIDPGVGIINTPNVVEDCIGGDECKIISGSSGNVDAVHEKAGNVNWGRMNWEQLR